MTLSLPRIFALLFLNVLLVQSVMADEPRTAEPSATPSWVPASTLSIEYDSKDPGRSPDFTMTTRAIRSSGSENSPIVFSCAVFLDGRSRLYASIQLNPGEPIHKDVKRFGQGRTRFAKIEIDGERFSTLLIYRRRSNTVHVSPLTSTAPKLYNAVLKDAEATLIMGSKTYMINLPSRDDVFTYFATSCPVTNGGNVERWNSELLRKPPVQLQAR